MTRAQNTPQRTCRWDWLLVPALALAILGFDQYTKHLVRTNLNLYDSVTPLPALSHLFTFTFVTNTGAAFGFFPDRSLFFVIVAILVSLGIVLYLRHIPRHEWLLKLSLAMQLGGALGNLLDRIRLGYVVDFVDFRAWPVFNFSDTFIVVGVILLAYRLLLRPDPFLAAEEGGSDGGTAPAADGSPAPDEPAPLSPKGLSGTP